MGTCSHVCVCRNESRMLGIFFFITLNRVSHSTGNLTLWLDWVGSSVLGLCRIVQPCLAFYMSAGHSNSGPHACKVSVVLLSYPVSHLPSPKYLSLKLEAEGWQDSSVNKVLTLQHEDLISITPESTLKKEREMWWHMLLISALAGQILESHWPASLAYLVSSRAVRDHAKKRKIVLSDNTSLKLRLSLCASLYIIPQSIQYSLSQCKVHSIKIIQCTRFFQQRWNMV